MKAVLQRVSHAEVCIDGQTAGKIGQGLVILLGVAAGDSTKEAECLAAKTAALRIFCDQADKMNLSVLDVGGQALVVSNFTLCADCKKGKRPSFDKAALPLPANELYKHFIECLKLEGVTKVETGRFGADMQLSLVNDGPVTIILDTDFLH